MNKPETIPKIQTLLNQKNPPVDEIKTTITDKPIINKPNINKPSINNSFINTIIDTIIDKPNDTVKQFNIPNTYKFRGKIFYCFGSLTRGPS